MDEQISVVGHSKTQNSLRTIISAWLTAGTLDITVASIYYPAVYGIKLIRMYQGIASGVLGAKAFTGGIATAALGLALHYLIALIWTILFFILYPRIRLLSKNRPATAALYGVFVSFVMRLVVLPLSNVNHNAGPVDVRAFAVDTIILMFTIGSPMSLIIGKYYSRTSRRARPEQ